MTKSFKEALKARRTFYRIQNKSTLSDKEIRDLICFAVEFVPSAFNSQTTRVVLLTGKAHEKLWNIVKNVLRKRVPAEVFGKTEEKIDGCFACGYGTILYFEDMAIVRSLQESFPTYKIISLSGQSRPMLCISWQSGPCWKMQEWGRLCSIIIR